MRESWSGDKLPSRQDFVHRTSVNTRFGVGSVFHRIQMEHWYLRVQLFGQGEGFIDGWIREERGAC